MNEKGMYKMSVTVDFNVTELQYLRGLILADQLENDYKNHPTIRIDNKTNMNQFTAALLDKLMEKDY